MKVKLLKKVRSRFSIHHMPNGYVSSIDGEHHNYNLFALSDKVIDRFSLHSYYAQLGRSSGNKQFVNNAIFDTERECINYLKGLIVDRLRREGHRGRKDKIIRNSCKKVWHVTESTTH